MCFFTNWSQYRRADGKFLPENVDPSLCTHIIFSFAKLVIDKIEPYEWNDQSTEWSDGNYRRMMNLKEQNPKLKILLAIGGWNHGSAKFSDVVNNDVQRTNFVNNAVNYLKKYCFDGLDIGKF